MKTTRFIIAAFAAAIVASCTAQPEALVATDNNAITEITAGFENTKTALQSDGKVFWEVGDAINLFYGTDGSKFTSTLTEAAAVSKFSGSLNILFGSEGDSQATKGGLTGTEDYLWGVYPYNEANTSDGKSVTAVLPATQIARAGSFAKDAYLTVGRSETPVMGFYAVGGAIKFTLGSSNIKSVVLRGNNAESLAGNLKVEFVDGVPSVSKISSASAIVTLQAPEGETLQAGTEYYIALPPVNFTQGFEMIFTTSDNKMGTRKSTAANELKRSVVANIGVADDGVEFVQKTWSAATVIPYAAGTLAFEINPVSKQPELAIVQNVASSRGPVLDFSDLSGSPVTVTPEANTNNQYVALGINAAGKAYVYTQNYTAKNGEIYSSADKAAWTAEITDIAQSNAYWGNTIGFAGDEVFMITGNNAKGTLAKRALNITKYSAGAWTKDNAFPNFSSAAYCLYPMLRTFNGTLYAFVTNYGSGLSVSKYVDSAWKEIATFTLTSGDYAKYAYGVYEHQEMAFSSDGHMIFAIGATSDPTGAAVIEFNPEETDLSKALTQIGATIPVTNSVSYRSARVGINPVNDDIYLVYRDSNGCLNVSKLGEDYETWGAPEQLTYSTAGDIEVRFNTDGKGFIACTTGGHVEVFSLL